jgi:hypothetical protein
VDHQVSRSGDRGLHPKAATPTWTVARILSLTNEGPRRKRPFGSHVNGQMETTQLRI